MARAQNADHLMQFNFSLKSLRAEGDPFDALGGESHGVGFSSVGQCEVSAEVEKIYEGNWPLPRSVIRRGDVGTIVLRRGILSRDSDFYNWFHAALFGFIHVRKSLLLTMLKRDGQEAKAWVLHDCIPTSVTAWPELDATTGEVAVAEVTLQPGWVEEISVSSND